MRAVRILAIVLTTGLMLSALLYAQTASDVALPAGDAVRGKAVFEGNKGNCMSCHRVNGNGSLYGPDLTAIGAPPRGGGGGGRGGGGGNARGAAAPPAAPTAQQFAQKLLDPNAMVSVQNRYVRLVMKDGKTISGKLLNLDTFGIQILDSTEKLVNVSKINVRDMAMVSPMPSYRDKFSTQELADVIGYLMSLKGQ